MRHFNPRSPHRERLQILPEMLELTLFQSTLPSQGATHLVPLANKQKAHFNPRSPHRERRTVGRVGNVCLHDFNPRSPHRERPTFDIESTTINGISIHAPLTGSDLCCANLEYVLVISIHAPLTGSDMPFLPH